ncbi:MAG: PocR ligand-binding domain-containing protein [Lachnospiraceae bacterium]|nr:PocR ligand-binding domain-containing protein [Lachnospiraceae bacterium]
MTTRNIDKYSFEDLFDMEKVQKLTDAMSMALEVGVVIVSPEGEPITRPSNFCHFCMNIVRKTPIGKRNCARSDSILGRKSDRPITSKCLSAGLTDAGISIIIDGKHIASWMIGQVLIEDDMLTEKEMRERARFLGIDEEVFIENIKTIPIRTREQFERMIEMVHEMALQLSELGLKNFQQKEEIAYRAEREAQLRNEKEKLEQYHQYDELTKLFTRVYYEDQLDELVRAKRYPIVIISGDMNNLKLSNDVFGHHMGDKALRTLGEIFRKEAGDDWLIGRCGGDEFQIAIPHGRLEEAEEYCKRVHRDCVNVVDAMIPPSVSLGYHVLRSAEEDLQEAVKKAEEAMYNAKMIKKQKQNIQHDIMEVLYRKQYISERQVSKAVKRIEDFCNFLGLDDYTIQIMKKTAQIQDVGLIGVPEAVVKKETKRTEDEYKKMARHTEIGYRLARLYDESFQSADIILQSHECWEGNGYPRGLKGREILYTARILYMVSTFSGWIYPRPTGSGMEIAAAKERLRSESGKQFDPELVEKFMQYLEIEELSNR